MVPAFTVFQTPPEPTATYHVLGSVGSIAMSAMRPDMSAGPMARSFRPSNVLAAGDTSSFGGAAGTAGFAPFGAVVLTWAPAAGPWSASSETAASDARRRAFMGDLRS